MNLKLLYVIVLYIYIYIYIYIHTHTHTHIYFFLTFFLVARPFLLFGLAVEGFAERFTEAQKFSQAMQHFLPKRTSSSSASSRPRPAPTQQTAKPTSTSPEPDILRVGEIEGAHDSARRYPLDRLGSGASEILLISQAERGGA